MTHRYRWMTHQKDADDKIYHCRHNRMILTMKLLSSISLLLLASLTMVTHAWVVSSLKKAATVATVSGIIGSSLIANAVDFQGSYADPFHPNCERVITTSTARGVTLRGTDGNPGCPVDGSGREWTLTGTVNGNDILVDFTPKGGPKDLKGVWDGDGIRWPDGNKWALKISN
jgi:hypothetical protein